MQHSETLSCHTCTGKGGTPRNSHVKPMVRRQKLRTGSLRSAHARQGWLIEPRQSTLGSLKRRKRVCAWRAALLAVGEGRGARLAVAESAGRALGALRCMRSARGGARAERQEGFVRARCVRERSSATFKQRSGFEKDCQIVKKMLVSLPLTLELRYNS